MHAVFLTQRSLINDQQCFNTGHRWIFDHHTVVCNHQRSNLKSICKHISLLLFHCLNNCSSFPTLYYTREYLVQNNIFLAFHLKVRQKLVASQLQAPMPVMAIRSMCSKFCSPWGKPPGSICGLILLKLCTEQVTGHPHRKWPAATWRPETRLKSMMFRWNNRRQHKVTSSRLSPTKATTNESEG